MAEPELLVKEISDLFLRKNFEKLRDYFAAQNQLLNFKFFEVNLTGGSGQLLAHGLNTAPLDVILTHLSGSGSITFNYGLFDSTNINLTVTGSVRARFFIGTYFDSQGSVTTQTADAQTFSVV